MRKNVRLQIGVYINRDLSGREAVILEGYNIEGYPQPIRSEDRYVTVNHFAYPFPDTPPAFPSGIEHEMWFKDHIRAVMLELGEYLVMRHDPLGLVSMPEEMVAAMLTANRSDNLLQMVTRGRLMKVPDGA